ncbi:hypothetical protein RUND412_001066 [Rhizina undulata]
MVLIATRYISSRIILISRNSNTGFGLKNLVGGINSGVSTIPESKSIFATVITQMAKRRHSNVAGTSSTASAPQTNPDNNPEIFDGCEALRASPSATDEVEVEGIKPYCVEEEDDGFADFHPEPEESELSEEFEPEKKSKLKGKRKRKLSAKAAFINGDGEGASGRKRATKKRVEKIEVLTKRPPEFNCDFVPVPWKGRLGFACLNTYLRTSNPPVFCSRTCRIDTIIKKEKEGRAYIESLGLANAWDLVKMIHWNEKYGIKFLRISSEMFPFASHLKYGYDLTFAKEPLREAGRVAMKYGHRLTVHPGQYTQIASPRREVITASVRDLEYHAQLLGLLGLEDQADKDAVMILHMGGMFGDKAATLNRFRKYYKTLSDDVKARLVLENDDVVWTVHDLLPICKELNIPLVLDYHHHNIRHREDLRDGSRDLMPFLPEIKETWSRRGITQKQHYSEPRDEAITDRDRRKHSARVRNLPPCEPTMDLMIEAKDKEQAVFELYRKYGIGGEGLINDIIPHIRTDENKLEKPKPKPKLKSKLGKKGKGKGKKGEKAVEEKLEEAVKNIPDEEVGMGGEERRVYWPEGKEEWLKPPKRIRKPKSIEAAETLDVATEETIEEPQHRHKKIRTKAASRTTLVVADKVLTPISDSSELSSPPLTDDEEVPSFGLQTVTEELDVAKGRFVEGRGGL